MANETGGRADKFGNLYEKNCIINYYIEIVKEKIKSCSFEKLGDDEKGTDITIENYNNIRTLIQCKERNVDANSWSLSKLASKKILENWLFHLNRNQDYKVALQTPLSAVGLEDLIKCANNTDEPNNFYESQIKSSKTRKKDFDTFCSFMNIKISQDYEGNIDKQDILKSLNYLRRIEILQTPDSNFKNFILEKIETVFINDSEEVYRIFLDLIENGNVLAKDVDIQYLYRLFRDNNINLRTLETDELIVPNIDKLNKQFKDSAILIKNQLIERNEILESIEEIEKGNSLIIHGMAGIGKSSCIKGIIDYLESNSILYLALKLDIKKPAENEKNWSKKLGFEFCISDCIDRLSNNKKAVLILDQLDALRWTQANSRDSLDVCKEILEKIGKLNSIRENKISVIFTCRTYDLENDSAIKMLLKDNSETDNNAMKWNKIKIELLDDVVVKQIVGENWNLYNQKLKHLLRVPSNLFIWNQIKKNSGDFNIHNTGMLIDKWWEQIEDNGLNNHILSDQLLNARKLIIQKMIYTNKNSILKQSLDISVEIVRFLCSQQFIIINNDTIIFAHQSILDYYTVKNMLEQYHNGESLIKIIGDKNLQTPNKRYQLQMLLEQIIIYDGTEKLIEAIKYILNSSEFRSYLKFVCYEVLSQIDNVDDYIFEFVLENLNDNIINIVIKNHLPYVSKFIEKGVFNSWIADDEKIKIVVMLLKSVCNIFTDVEIDFIQSNIGKSNNTDRELYNSLDYEITNEDDKLFELRLKLYEKYPELYNLHLNIQELFKINEQRAIKIIKHHFIYHTEVQNNIYCEFNVENYKNIGINNYSETFEELLDVLPKIGYTEFKSYDWESRRIHDTNIRRLIINILKKVNLDLIQNNSNDFWEKYSNYLGKGYVIYNELILSAMLEFPKEYAHQILKYIFSNIDKNAFEYTSGNSQKITYVKEIIKKFIVFLNKEEYEDIEKLIMQYIPLDIIDSYKYLNSIHKEYGYCSCYSSFWGDFQLEIFKQIPIELLSVKAKKTLDVLKRKYKDEKSTKFDNHFMQSGNVVSVLSGKKLSNKAWEKISKKKMDRENERSLHKFKNGTFISSDVSDLLSSFSEEVKADPIRFINLALANKPKISSKYILNIYSALAYGERLNEIDNELLEKFFTNFPIEEHYERSSYFCTIIYKKNDTNWSENVINSLINVYHIIKNNQVRNERLINDKDEESNIISRALNSTIGDFSNAIENLLWNNKQLFLVFEGIITEMLECKDNITNYCLINMLKPCLNIRKEWSIKQILKLCKNNYVVLYNYEIRDILNWCYCNEKSCRNDIEEIINSIAKHKDGEFKKNIGYLIIDLYILYAYKAESLNDLKNDKLLNEGITEMLVAYYKTDREKVKPLLLKINNISDEYNYYIGRIFYNNLINIKEDEEFIKELLTSANTNRIISAFIHYISESNDNIIIFKDMIILFAKNILINNVTTTHIEEYEINELINLVVKLYDSVSDKANENGIKIKCMEIWDVMFENKIGNIREISKKIIDM